MEEDSLEKIKEKHRYFITLLDLTIIILDRGFFK